VARSTHARGATHANAPPPDMASLVSSVALAGRVSAAPKPAGARPRANAPATMPPRANVALRQRSRTVPSNAPRGSRLVAAAEYDENNGLEPEFVAKAAADAAAAMDIMRAEEAAAAAPAAAATATATPPAPQAPAVRPRPGRSSYCSSARHGMPFTSRHERAGSGIGGGGRDEAAHRHHRVRSTLSATKCVSMT